MSFPSRLYFRQAGAAAGAQWRRGAPDTLLRDQRRAPRQAATAPGAAGGGEEAQVAGKGEQQEAVYGAFFSRKEWNEREKELNECKGIKWWIKCV